jgi:hypothetical protein
MEQGAKSREEFRISHFGLFIAFIALFEFSRLTPNASRLTASS